MRWRQLITLKIQKSGTKMGQGENYYNREKIQHARINARTCANRGKSREIKITVEIKTF